MKNRVKNMKKAFAILLSFAMVMSVLVAHPQIVNADSAQTLTIISADGLFDDIEVSKSQLEAHATTVPDFVRDANRVGTVTGITLADLLSQFVPNYQQVEGVIFFSATPDLNDLPGNRTFFPHGLPAGVESDNDYSTAMLVWDSDLEDGVVSGLTSAIDNAVAGRYWWRDVIYMAVIFGDAPTPTPAPSVTAENGNWSQVAATAVAGVDFTAEAGFVTEVHTALGLAYFASHVNAGNNYEGRTVRLTAGVDIGAFNWSPIGQGIVSGGGSEFDQSNAFHGIFDGGGHHIDNMTIGGPDFSVLGGRYSEANALFGINHGTITSVGVRNVDVTTARQGAGIAAINHGTVTLTMSSGVIRANGGGGTRGTGGIVGSNRGGTVSYSYSTANVVNIFRRVGGIVGMNVNVGGEQPGAVYNVWFDGFAENPSYLTFSGSVVGTNQGTITNSFYRSGSARDDQVNGTPVGFDHPGTSDALEVNAAGYLVAGGASVLSAIGDAFISDGDGGLMLAWEAGTVPIDGVVPITPTVPVVRTHALVINTRHGMDGETVMRRGFTHDELMDMAVSGVFPNLFFRGGTWEAIVATELVSLGDLLSAAGIDSAYWTSGSYLEFGVTGVGDVVEVYALHVPGFDEIAEGRYYIDEHGISTVIPAGLAIVWESGVVGTDARTAEVDALADRARDTGNLRFVFGVSPEQYAGESAMGRRSPHSVLEMTVIHEQPSVRPISIRFVIGSDSFTINGASARAAGIPFSESGRALVPLQALADGLGAQASWDNTSASITLGGQQVTMPIGTVLPGMDVPARLVQNTPFVPLRYVVEQFGLSLRWDRATRAMYIFND